MKKPTLVVLAGGMGSRYGGLKQIDPIGPNNELIIDYSIYDAIKAGFGKVVFIIKEENLEIFKEAIADKIAQYVDVEFAFQSTKDVPEQYKELCKDREKPWGTSHAVMSCRGMLDDTNFAVINADDYYGYDAFEKMYKFLESATDEDVYNYCMIGFVLGNTLTENGHVARGVCEADGNGNLAKITERTKIQRFGDKVKYTEDGENWVEIPADSLVSMNMWGFTPSVMNEIIEGFPKFIENNKDNLMKGEYFLPLTVDDLIKSGKAKIKVISCDEKWYGVTYKEDKPMVQKALRDMIESGKYPSDLWGAVAKK
ncbi:MAG: nucleotidyltransferase [Oscillospiraceae bacterium]|nr:nucleotidyltransferase [Oscillospiraceae bacterium]